MPTPPNLDSVKAAIQKHWGYATLRPLQEQAILADLQGRDSLVVLPTGGGKSLCYQAPAVCRAATTVVVSPLISLMKDQVDSLRACGVAAVQIDSSQSLDERQFHEDRIRGGDYRLLFVSPERMVLTDFCRLLQELGVRTFAIDEAHCISHWGHDFRPEYRQLSRLRERFPGASVHAYTATATEQVRGDIIGQLGLVEPAVLVGSFDRPNLNYRVLPRRDLMNQVVEVIDRHREEAGIIYCIRRRDVDDLSAALQQRGCKALPYHAGLSAEQRRATQNAFSAEECDLVVATVAFGMGIDRSNIRFVLHTAMPKTVEHYQQETGRAGRDGLEAECVLLYSGSDTQLWRTIIRKSAAEPGVGPDFFASAHRHLEDMDRYCRGAMCRHRALVQYFGQGYEPQTCAACDICLGDTEPVPDAAVVAQKILSCIARVKERFGITHVIGILRGENTEKIRKFGHEQLSTYGLLHEHKKEDIRDWIYQLIGQGVLLQEDLQLSSGDRVPILRLNAASWEVMKGQRKVRLVRLARREKVEKSRAEAVSWEGVDRELFDALRGLRHDLAVVRQVPPYIIFGDATLRELAGVRPSSLVRMRLIYGVGDAKLRDFGDRFLQVIVDHCRRRGLEADVARRPARVEPPPLPVARTTATAALAFELFRQGTVIEDVMHQTGRSRSTVVDYLGDFIRREKPAALTPWVADPLYQRIAAAVRQVGTERLKPIYLALGEQVSYDDIRLVVAHLSTGPA